MQLLNKTEISWHPGYNFKNILKKLCSQMCVNHLTDELKKKVFKYIYKYINRIFLGTDANIDI